MALTLFSFGEFAYAYCYCIFTFTVSHVSANLSPVTNRQLCRLPQAVIKHHSS